MERLKEVTEKICELLKGSELYPMEMVTDYFWNTDNVVDAVPIEPQFEVKPIREAEILMAFSRLPMGDEFAISEDGIILIRADYEWDNSECRTWILGKTLSQQPKETIEFLHQILVG